MKVTFQGAQPKPVPIGELSEEDVVHSAKKKRVSFGEDASAATRHEPVSTLSGSTAAPATPLKSALVHHSLPDTPEAPKTKRKRKKSRLSAVDEGADVSTSKELSAESSTAPGTSGKRKRKEDTLRPPEDQVTVFTEASGAPLSAKKKRMRSSCDEEHPSTPSKPANGFVDTGATVPPKEPKVKTAKKEKKGKETVASELDRVDPKVDTAIEVLTPCSVFVSYP